MLRRPLVGLALSIVAGMLLAATGWFSLEGFFWGAVVFLLLSIPFIHRRSSGYFILVGVALCAACRFMMVLPSVQVWGIPQLGNEVSVIGRISGNPEFHAYATGDRGVWVFPLQVDRVKTSTGWKKERGELEARISSSATSFVQYGQRIWLNGRLQARTFPGRSAFEVVSASPQACKIVSKGIPSVVVLGRTWRNAASQRLEVGLRDDLREQRSVLKALVLGDRADMPNETMAQFRRTGLVHIFAISGLHVGMVGLLLVIIFKTLGIPRDRFGIWLLPLLSMYVISTGMKASALRALAMAAVFVLAPMFRRKPDVPSSVAFAAMVLLTHISHLKKHALA